MSYSKEQTKDLEVKYLENFISENKELEELETIVNKFNIFTSLKIQYIEIRHSNYLSWILDPLETHGLGDYFLKILLKRILKNASNYGLNDLSIIDIDIWNLEHVEVRREWENIDLILIDESNKFVVVIENKVGSKEHGDQLERYYNKVYCDYPYYKKVFVYLSVEGDKPNSDENNYWVPISYKEVADSIEYLLQSKRTNLGSDIEIFISHYHDMLRRYIVKESRVEELCRLIYKNHKHAIDLIIEHKPDRQADISEMIQDIINSQDILIPDISSKQFIRFITTSMDFIPKKGQGWTKTKRILLFEIQNLDRGISLKLIIGPGEQEIRQKIFDLGLQNKSIFNSVKEKLSSQWTVIYSKNLVKADRYENVEIDDLRLILENEIQKWKDKALPKIDAKISHLNLEL